MVLAFLDTNAHNERMCSIIHDVWTGNKNRMSADIVKVVIDHISDKQILKPDTWKYI